MGLNRFGLESGIYKLFTCGVGRTEGVESLLVENEGIGRILFFLLFAFRLNHKNMDGILRRRAFCPVKWLFVE